MSFFQYKKSTVSRLAMIVSSLAVILLLAHSACAQSLTLTPNPTNIQDTSKPTDVVLHVTKAGGAAIDQTTANQFGTVKVGDTNPVPIKSTDVGTGNVTFTAPTGLSGDQKVQLLDKSNQPLGETHLQYPAQSSSATPTPTPPIDIRQNSLSMSWWFRAAVIILFLGLVGVFVYTLGRVINFSRASFRNPLGFPVGSFRAMLAFTLVAFLGFYVFVSVLSISTFPPPESLLGIVATVIGFYFGSRSNEEGGTDPGNLGIVRGVVNAGPDPARGAVVKFKRDDNTEPYIRVTDVEGRFAPVNAKPGKYTVRAELTGLPPGEVAITVSEGSDQEIVIPIKTGQTPAPPRTGIVQGTVTKADKSAAAGATVTLSQADKKQNSTTDANGKYKFDNVAPGDYSIVATLAGVSSDPTKVTVAAGATQTADLQLKQP